MSISSLVLEVVSQGGARGTILVKAGEVTEMGRATLLALGIPADPHMSARHFAIECDPVRSSVRDLGSTNGTFVNGVRVTGVALNDGDRIEAGQSSFVIRFCRDSESDRGGSSRSASATAIPPALDAPPGVDEAPSVTSPREYVATGDRARVSAASIPVLEIAKNSPIPVGTVRWQDTNDKAKLSIVIKATFTIADTPEPTPKQLPIFNTDILTDGDPPSIRFESDLVPFKPCTDVILVGRAYAPEGKPVSEMVAGLRVGQLRYGVAVIGDRKWQAQLLDKATISHTQPFLTMDLIYERAFGGFDKSAGMYCKENHVGTGFIGKRTTERIEGLLLPNLEDPRNRINAWNSRPRPVGFGFYGRGWAPRLAYAGTYDQKYMKERYPLLPVDFSFRFFNGAHPDLQVGGYLRGDEEVDLLNVCPDASRMRFRLPGVVPKITVARWTVSPEQWVQEHAGPDGSLPVELPLVEESLTTVLDTLVFVPDRGVFYEVFRAVCSLSSLESLEVARVTVTH